VSRGRHPWTCIVALALLVGCVSDDSKRDAINAINAEFKASYEASLARDGTRIVNATPNAAFDAVIAAFVKLGLVVTQQSRGLGVITAEAPAPRPLDRNDWDRAAAADLPQTRELLRRYIGALAELFHFEPEGLDTVMTATIIGRASGSEVSFTMRMREVAPPKQNLPRRDYPPPTALKIGLAKVWAQVDAELAARRP
jgi:hypothetical protein